MYSNLKALIYQHNMTQHKLAKILKIHPSTLSSKILGKKDFNITEVEKIIKLFNKPFDYVFSKKSNKINYTNIQL